MRISVVQIHYRKEGEDRFFFALAVESSATSCTLINNPGLKEETQRFFKDNAQLLNRLSQQAKALADQINKEHSLFVFDVVNGDRLVYSTSS